MMQNSGSSSGTNPKEEKAKLLLKKYGRFVEANKIIFREGDKGNHMFIIKKGRVKITQNVKGQEKLLMVLDIGDFFGEMAILDNSPRSATASALEDTVLLALNREGFINMVKQNANISLSILDKLCKRLRRADMMIADLRARDLRSMVLNQFLDMVKIFADDENIMSRIKVVDEIAKQVDIKPDHVEDILSDIANMGLIEINKNEIILVNPDEVDRISSFFRKRKTFS